MESSSSPDDLSDGGTIVRRQVGPAGWSASEVVLGCGATRRLGDAISLTTTPKHV